MMSIEGKMGTRCKDRYNSKQAGFTLVELSVVLVIIGFLIAGITSATSMIKQAELRSVIYDLNTYATAFSNFRARYDAVPGDFNNAITIFSPICNATGCNGNGDGIINNADVAGSIGETQAVWVHLSAAGFIAARFVPIGGSNLIIGYTTPNSKIPGVGYMMLGGSDLIGTTLGQYGAQQLGFAFDATKNAVILGREPVTGADRNTLFWGAIPGRDAYFIDSKMDDGRVSNGTITGAGSGILMAANGYRSGDVCLGATGAATATSVYNITSTSTGCNIGLALN